MAASFPNPNSDSGLKKLDEHLLTRTYITGYEASKDDITVFTALANPPSTQYVNASRWYNHIDTLLRPSGVFAEGSGVIVEGPAPLAEEAVATSPAADSKLAMGGRLLSIEPLDLIDDMKGKTEEEISQTICKADLNTLLGSLKVTHKKTGPGRDPFHSVVVQHLEGKSEDEISKMIRYEHLRNLPKFYKVAKYLSLDTLKRALILHLDTPKSLDELSQMLDLKSERMSLIKLIQMTQELPGPSQLYRKCKSHIKGKSSEVLKEAILDLDLKDLIRIVQVSEHSGKGMRKLLNVVVDQLVGKSREDLSKMVSTKCESFKRYLLLDEAEEMLRKYQEEFIRKRNEATNNKFLKKWKKLFKAVVLPKLEDEGLIRFRIACRGASKLVNSEIHSRYISLKKNEIPLQAKDVEIKLESDYGFSVNVSLRGSLQSGILCAKRVENIQKFGREYPVTEYMGHLSKAYLRIVSGYCRAASSEDVNALATWAVELENVPEEALLEIMRVAQNLKMKGLLLMAAEAMAQRINGSGQVFEMCRILSFPEEESFIYEDDRLAYLVQDIRPFLELMIPMLNDESYLRFAGLGNASAVLVNEVQARKCFRAGQKIDPWTITLTCTNGKTLKASEAIIALSGLIKNKQLENPLEDNLQIHLQSTTEQVLNNINTYCVIHTRANVSDDQLRRWDAKFFRKANANTLFHVAKGAVEMKIRILVDFLSQTLAAMINNKTVQEIRASFDLKDDFYLKDVCGLKEDTSYVEREWRRKHEWAFESDPLPVIERETFPFTSDPTLTEDDFLAALPESERERYFARVSYEDLKDEDAEEDKEAVQEDETAKSDESETSEFDESD